MKKYTEKNEIPEDILKLSKDILGFYPSILETDYYTIDALKIILKKNSIIWSNKYFDGKTNTYLNGIIEFKGNDKMLFYFKKRENENTYKLYCLSKEESTDSVIFYLNQLKKLGCSCDWSRTRFTLDKEYVKAVETAFLHYYKKGWIYQGPRIVNWCPRCSTAISDIEIKYKPSKTKLWYIKYPIKQIANTGVSNA